MKTVSELNLRDDGIPPRILFLIKSAPDNHDRRKDQEESWLRTISEGSDYYFCIGDNSIQSCREDGRLLRLPVPDGYDHLPAKMKAMAAWAVERPDFDYLVTMDDDVVVSIPRLHELLIHNPDHFGNRWDGNPAHISGMFVGYSRRAVGILAEAVRAIPDTGPDDLLVSRAVHEAFGGLNVMTDEERFKPYGAKVTSRTIAAEIRPYRLGVMSGFNFEVPEPRNKVSFCLYGNDSKYVRGAIENVELVFRYYPGWEPVFHTRDVEQAVIAELRSLGATVVECDYRNMMLARFLPFCEEGIVLSRDCDSRIGPREVRAVNEWLATDKPAHVIRDHPEHIPGWALIPGGLWGSRLPFGDNLRSALLTALNDPRYEGWGGDQRWLVEHVWRPDGFNIHQYDQVDWMRESWREDEFCGMRHEIHRPFIPREVVLFEGFFNRLNGLVNAWLTLGPGFWARWAVNSHLPHQFEDLFENVPGVEVADAGNLRYWQENTDPQKGPLCYWYVSKNCGAEAEQVEAAYRHFISKLRIEFNEAPGPLGIHYRGFHHGSKVPPADFARWCLDHARARNLSHCFAIADSGRDQIQKVLEEGGVSVVWGASSPLDHDLDRNSLEDLRRFIGDVVTLAHCGTVLTSFDETTIVDPARAFGREVIAYSGSRAWSECWFHQTTAARLAAAPESTQSIRKDKPLRILVADILLEDHPHSDWKEGYELCHAFRNLGLHCDVAGPCGAIPEEQIPHIADQYDLVVITDNYPGASGWKWWDWRSVKTPKLFWAIDTHLVDFRNWIRDAEIDMVAFNNPQDLQAYGHRFSFFMTYAASRVHHGGNYEGHFSRDLAFIGGITPERRRLCEKFGIEMISAFGADYVREMRQSRICLNQSISYDLNAKYFDIIASGSFMLTNHNEHFHELMEFREDIGRMLCRSEDELGEKIQYFLANENERLQLAESARNYVLEHHSWENRAQLIIENYRRFNATNSGKKDSLDARAKSEYRQIGHAALETAFGNALSRLEALRVSDRSQYVYGTHIEALNLILKTLDPAPGEALSEIGGGDFSTPLLLATGARVFTLEQGQNVPPEDNAAWLERLKATYQSHRNWHLLDHPGTEEWRQAIFPPGILFCFVDGNGNCRKEIVEFMLARGVPVVAAHDSETASYRYDQIVRPDSHSVHDFRGREVWTRVWSAHPALTRKLNEDPVFVTLKPALAGSQPNQHVTPPN